MYLQHILTPALQTFLNPRSFRQQKSFKNDTRKTEKPILKPNAFFEPSIVAIRSSLSPATTDAQIFQ